MNHDLPFCKNCFHKCNNIREQNRCLRYKLFWILLKEFDKIKRLRYCSSFVRNMDISLVQSDLASWYSANDSIPTEENEQYRHLFDEHGGI